MPHVFDFDMEWSLNNCGFVEFEARETKGVKGCRWVQALCGGLVVSDLKTEPPNWMLGWNRSVSLLLVTASACSAPLGGLQSLSTRWMHKEADGQVCRNYPSETGARLTSKVEASGNRLSQLVLRGCFGDKTM